jgi:hemerythrin
MRRYAALHFKDEEAAMESAVYPDVRTHAEEHATFAKRLEEMEAEHARLPSSPWLTLNLAVELGHWLRDHILEKDRAFGLFLQKK